MNPQYTYRTNQGVFYFRLILAGDSEFSGTEIRFSLRTKEEAEARERAHIAWKTANSLIEGDYEDAKAFCDKVKSTTFRESSTRPDPLDNTPELKVLSQHINSANIESIQNAITQVANAGGRIFVPYSPYGFIPSKHADARSSIFRIHDPQYEDEPRIPLEVEIVFDNHVALTTQGVKAASFTEKDNFKVTEFYSYNHRNNWTKKSGFSIRIVPSPFRVKLTEVLIPKKYAAALSIPSIKESVHDSGDQKTTKCKSIREELEKYSNLKRLNNHWSIRTKNDYESVFKTFVEIIGNKLVKDITMEDIELYSEKIINLPSNRNKNPVFSGLTANDAIALNIERGAKVISYKTKQKYLERLNGPFDFFKGRKWIPYNYFSQLMKPRLSLEDDIESGMNVRHPFSLNDLKAMFEGEDSIRILAKKQGYPSRPWGMLIALYSGLRAEEIFSLLIDNVVVDGDPHFNITVTKGHNRLKNKSAPRKIPIHPKLLELGFKQYVEISKRAQKYRKTALLFPELRISVHHGWSRNTTRWFNEKYLTKLNLKTEKKVFHSFRHLVVDHFKSAEQLTVFKANYFIGHRGKDDPEWVDRYGSDFKTAPLKEITDLIEYDIDFNNFRKRCLDTIRIKHLKKNVAKNS